MGLVPETKILNERAILLDIGSLEVVEQPATLADHLEQAATTVMVFRVRAEMPSEVADPLGKERNLHSCRSGIPFVGPVLVDRRCLVERHRRNIR